MVETCLTPNVRSLEECEERIALNFKSFGPRCEGSFAIDLLTQLRQVGSIGIRFRSL